MNFFELNPAFRFIVTLYPSDAFLPTTLSAFTALVPEAAFRSVGGLAGELEVLTYAEGGVNDMVHQLPVRHSWGRISLKRGIMLGTTLWDWYATGLNDPLGARRDGTIILLNHQGIPSMAWHFHAGIAAKWAGPDLDAMTDGVAMESLEIAHHGLTYVSLAAIPF